VPFGKTERASPRSHGGIGEHTGDYFKKSVIGEKRSCSRGATGDLERKARRGKRGRKNIFSKGFAGRRKLEKGRNIRRAGGFPKISLQKHLLIEDLAVKKT